MEADLDIKHFKRKLAREHKASYVQGAVALKNYINAKDKYTLLHSMNVSKYACLIGKEVGLSIVELQKLAVASLLHDIGKARIPLEILVKKNRLTQEEYEIIKIHPIIGSKIIENQGLFSDCIEAIMYHHERFDGKGYPHGLKGLDIPFHARIISVVDSFDAMTTNRVYKKAKTLNLAIDELENNIGTQFDGEIVSVFTNILKREKVKIS